MRRNFNTKYNYIYTNLTEDRFIKQKVPSVNPTETIKSYLYLKNIIKVIRNQISLSSQTYVNLCPKASPDNNDSHSIQTEHVQLKYEDVKEDI